MAEAAQATGRFEEPLVRPLARTGLAAGAFSVVLLGLAIRFAHHWNSVSLTLVSAWALSVLVTLAASGRALARATKSRRAARWGLAFGLVSVLALAIAGIALAAGADPAGACGGG